MSHDILLNGRGAIPLVSCFLFASPWPDGLLSCVVLGWLAQLPYYIALQTFESKWVVIYLDACRQGEILQNEPRETCEPLATTITMRTLGAMMWRKIKYLLWNRRDVTLVKKLIWFPSSQSRKCAKE